ncbi:hypothetical protein Pcac1_g24521 [Phytophthora cactorum]|nr:hypothetical protein Pcac1_g24521 [Phytophthora cactorum]
MNVVTLRVSEVIAALVQALRLHSILGFVRPHHFRNVLHQNVPRFPCISVGEEILSNEYEDERDQARLQGFLAHDSLDYHRVNRAHRTVAAAGAEIYPSYGQPPG